MSNSKRVRNNRAPRVRMWDTCAMLVFGLAGGIASGKSTVSDILKELGCSIIDTDVLARAVVEPGRPAWKEVVKHFGEGILYSDRTINREKLGSLIFNDNKKRHTLNRCTHPYIGRAVLWELAKHFIKGKPYVVYVSPLLFETKYALRYLRQIIVVSCTTEQQLSRLMTRDRLSEEQALKRIEAQIPLVSKCLWGDVVIDNSKDIITTRLQVERLVHSMNAQSYQRRRLYFIMVSIIILAMLYLLFLL